jgi:16S rRNA (guanine527-N7)-methyltransferase
MVMTENLLAEGLNALCKSDSDTARIIMPDLERTVTLLEKYIAEIELFNPALSLVGAKDRAELIVKHILDSLAPLGIITRLLDDLCRHDSNRDGSSPSVVDVGSGAGLPGIPLAICLQKISFTLLERMGRRAGFLRNTQAILALANMEIEEREMEQSPSRLDLAVFRAFKPLDPQILRGLLRLLKPGGFLAAYKGRRSAAETELSKLQLKDLPPINAEILPCPVPFLEEERHIVILRKTQNTI